ncbi:helix-turn-helix transcriptional regulator [Mycobacterium montefiorense]|uniref:helix-turn-helix transcriptional regulator n=1 Tax=Mycobacterium montefiorense TaxID=154654 RepID=UPI000D58C947|nr:helix-turn-helix transcriptional regulator [Mycobacterium montefiorense]
MSPKGQSKVPVPPASLSGSAPVDNELGLFLRASRARVEPAAAGLPCGASSRRVRGLRREEVAVLAGVSVDYYARLEQGRERKPSPSVIDAIGRALRLAPDACEHLSRLAGLNPRFKPNSPRDLVHPSLLRILEICAPRAAAYVLGPAFDLLAVNPISEALLTPFGEVQNMARLMFTHPLADTFLPDREAMQRNVVYSLRLNAGRFPKDSDITDIVAELRNDSPTFCSMWDEQDVGILPRAPKVFLLPELGRIELTYQTFDVLDAPGQRLRVGTPEPGSRSEQVLTRLAGWTAERTATGLLS